MLLLPPNCRKKLKMDDNLADYRRFCANRLKRLERCKKTKSFCNLDDEVPYPFVSSGSDLMMLRGSEIYASHGGNMTFSRCSENTALSSIKSETVPFCSGTSTFCARSTTSPVTNIPQFGSTGVFPMNFMSSIAEANPAKPALITDSWLQNSRECTPVISNFVQTDNGSGNNLHSSPSLCSSLTTASSTVSSQSSMLSTKKPELETRMTITAVNNVNDYGDSNRRAQRNFDILREKMVTFYDFKCL